jgi:peroxiredoxin
MTATEGQPAPGFTLLNSKMEEVSLANQRGKTVMLLFVPLAFTPT